MLAVHRKLQSLFILSVLSCVSVNSNAWHVCSGQVTFASIRGDGTVSIRSDTAFSDGQSRDICSLNSTWNGISPSTCKGFLGSAQIAQTTGKTLTLMYLDDTKACNAPPTSYPTPYSVWFQ